MSKPRTQREKLGVRYEGKVHARLGDQFGLAYIPSRWFAYGWRGEVKYCQTDGLLLLEARRLCVLVEVKYSHTADAYWQMEHVYVPVLREYLKKGEWQLATVEVVKWFDPAVHFPTKVVLREDLAKVKVGEFAVHILNR